MVTLRCPNCNATQIYTKKDGTRKCYRCGYIGKAKEFEGK